MRLNFLLQALLFTSFTFLTPAQPVLAQDIAPGGIDEEEEAPTVVTPTDVRDALLSLLDSNSPAPEAVTTGSPEIALGALVILMEPMTLNDLRVEIAGWYALFREAIAERSVAERCVF